LLKAIISLPSICFQTLIHDESQNNRLKVLSVNKLLDGQWHHCFVTYNGSSTAAGVTLYIDGRLARTIAVSNNLSQSIQVDAPFHIGMRRTQFPFMGQIDDVRIYNHRLSDQEVQELHEAGLRALANVSPDARTPEQEAYLKATYRARDEELSRLEEKLVASELELVDSGWKGIRRWYVNRQGQTMSLIPNAESSRGREITKCLAISSHEVTVEEYQRFRAQHVVDQVTAPTNDSPVHWVSWFNAKIRLQVRCHP
jgi:Concanavalin A-like lectin/glucanases superfamily